MPCIARRVKRSTNKLSVLLLLFFRKVLPPACHLERSPPEIPPTLCSVLLRSSTPLRFAQNDTGGRSRNPKGERQRRSDLAGRLKTALWKTPLGKPFLTQSVIFNRYSYHGKISAILSAQEIRKALPPKAKRSILKPSAKEAA